MDLPLPSPGAGGFTLGAIGAGNEIAAQNLKNHMQQLENKMYVPKTNATINSLVAETALKKFQLENPIYQNPEAFLYSNALNQGQNNQPNPNQNNANPLSGGMPEGQEGNSNPNINSLIQKKIDPLAYKTREAQVLANVDIGNKLISNAAEAGNQAANMSYALDSMGANRKKLLPIEKGAAFGRVPAISNAAQGYDLAVSQLNNVYARALQSGHITDKDYAYYKQSHPGRELNDQSFDTYHDFNSRLAKRMTEQGAFYAAAQKAGITPQIYQNLYTKYLNERPVYDYEHDKPLDSNLNSWKDYLNPKAIKATLNGEPYSPRLTASENKSSNIVTNEQVKNAVKKEGENYQNQTIEMIGTKKSKKGWEGKKIHVPLHRAQAALKAGFERVNE